jgi:ribonuclease T2
MRGMLISLAQLTVSLILPSVVFANSCVNSDDTFAQYDNKVKVSEINNITSDYYLLSYSWAPNFCEKASASSKRAGAKNFLQCGTDQSFGYILHGFWPQGSLLTKDRYPRACQGDQPKISRAKLEPYLCMTPSVWLLQHEYEYHGTCMSSAKLQTPEGYFNQAKILHQQLHLPAKELTYSSQNIQWWYQNNPHLVPGAVQFSAKSKEWQFCFDNNFAAMACPSRSSSVSSGAGKRSANINDQLNACVIKGNISKKSNKRLYFTADHPNYQSVKIAVNQGEKCFSSESAAVAAGWVKAK